MRRVLFLPIHAAALSVMREVAEYLRDEGLGEPVFCLEARFESWRAELVAHGFAVEPSRQAASVGAGPEEARASGAGRNRAEPLLRRLWRRFPRIAASRPIQRLVRRRTDRRLTAAMEQARPVMERVRPAALALSGDRHLGPELCFIALAKAAGIPRVILPIAFSNAEGVSRLRRDAPVYAAGPGAAPLNREVAVRFPGQVREVEGERYLFYKAGEILALDALGMLPERPWCMGGGDSTAVAVDGPEVARALASCGVDEYRIETTGHPEFDALHAATAADTLEERRAAAGIAPGPPVLVCALPHLGEHGLLPWEEHDREVERLTGILAATGAEILLSLHPKADPARYAALEEHDRVHLARAPLREVLPMADVFVASFSSTVRWALMVGVPVVLIDFGWFGYEAYDHYGGLVKVTDPAELPAVLARVLEGKGEAERLRREAEESARDIGSLDGRARERIARLLVPQDTRV